VTRRTAADLQPFGALSVLAGAFALSAVLRAGDVVAALPAPPEDGFGHALPAEDATVSADAAGNMPDEPDGVIQLVAELRARQAQVTEREARLTDRAQALEALEARLSARLAEIDAAQTKLEETAALVDDAAGRDVRHLAEMYQRMRPKEAGAIFDRMAPSFAAGFLGEMKPDAAAEIMANMSTERAYAVSLLLAGRNVEGSDGRAAGIQPSLKPTP